MPSISINTNLSSLIAQQNLKQSSNKLNLAVERMSTGFKINHAKDNAANYSISTNMTTKIGAYQVAEDNVAMGLDLLSTANGSLDQISDKLSRLRALAEQSANGTYAAQSRSAINAEANALVDEIERLYNTTEYNGKTLFYDSEPKFMKDVTRRDTTCFKKLSEMASDSDLTDGVYSISTVAELEQLAEMTNNGFVSAGDEFVLANNIDLSSVDNWTPIGTTSITFKGVFDGNGYIISNLKINRTEHNSGLFGNTQSATFKNLGIVDCDIQGAAYTGALVAYGYASITVENCYSTGKISVTSATARVGGLLGNIQTASIKDCFSTCDIYAPNCSEVGGLIGYVIHNYQDVTIENSYSAGDVLGYLHVGGFVGYLYDNVRVKNCYSTSNVKGNENVGGFVGVAGSNINLNDCYATGDVSATYKVVGGFIGGLNTESIAERCYSTGNVSCEGTFAGGFAGFIYSRSSVNNCFTTSNVTGKYYTGGFAGDLHDSPTIVNSYSLGSVTDIGNNRYVGSFLGRNTDSSNAIASNCACLSTSGFNPVGYNGDGLDVLEMTLDEIEEKYSNEVLGYTAANGWSIINGLAMFSWQNELNNKKDILLQVGINSGESSSIGISSSFSLLGISDLRNLDSKKINLLGRIDSIIQNISVKSTEIGAAQNRLESALDEISTQYENLVSSRSTLRDADISEVSSEYIRQQILQEASATLMATANQNPAIALQLL